MEGQISWEVYQADRKRAYNNGSKAPMASVHVFRDNGSSQFLEIPGPVGRKLAAIKKNDEAHPTTMQELQELIDNCTRHVAWTQLLNLLSRRDYTELESRQRLCSQGFSASVANDAVRGGVECGLVSNKRFAESYIRSKVSAGWGLERISRELRSRGIDVCDLDGWPYEYADPEQEYERAVQIASKKTVREPNRYAKLVRFLLGRGFSYGVSSDAAKLVLEAST